MSAAVAVTVLTPVSPLPFPLGVGPETDGQDLIIMVAWFLFGGPVLLLSFFTHEESAKL